jgi:hypothetical protein
MEPLQEYSLKRIMTRGWARHPLQLLAAMIKNDEREIHLSQFHRNATIVKLDSYEKSLQHQFSIEGVHNEER